MATIVEISRIDLRYERCRLSHAASERRLLGEVAEQGIKEPLLGIAGGDVHVLLDGFKRYRCAQRLGIHQVLFRSLADDDATAILALMRLANVPGLTPLEQACLIDELRIVHKLTVQEIAARLGRSRAWVIARQGLLADLTPGIRSRIMRGEFPLSAYMYNLRPVRRLTTAQPAEIEDFVAATAGKGLSVRDIGALAVGYFRGGEEFRGQLAKGDVNWCLTTLRAGAEAGGANDEETRVLADLDLARRHLKRLPRLLASANLNSPAFLAQAHILAGGILRLTASFNTTIRNLHDRTRLEKSRRHPARQGEGDPPDRQAARDQSGERAEDHQGRWRGEA